jgi:aminopeptidase-like protein
MEVPDGQGPGGEMHALVRELFPICRSITGDGVRQTLDVLSRFMPLALVEVPTGTPVLDWTVPREWNIRDAWIADSAGRRVVDFRSSNLHVVNYSIPVRARLSLGALRPHLHTLPDRPDWIPYRTSYYREDWGFCLSQRQLDEMPDGEYEVCIDSSLEEGHLTYGEFVLPGEIQDEILLSAHVCHPSLADDNLSGLAVSALLARHLAKAPRRRHTMRFLFAPGTIGSITWLARNRERAGRIRHGLTLVCLGDDHGFTYKRTIGGRAEIDRAAEHVLNHLGSPHEVIDFFPYGYDERQYNSPGFRLPVGSLMRGRHGQFPEYHTSADDPSFVSAERLGEAFEVVARVIDVLDGNAAYRNSSPWGEPQLGRRGLYRAVGGSNLAGLELAMLWVLTMSDGEHSLLDVAERARMDFRVVRGATDLLVEHGLLTPVPAHPGDAGQSGS